MKKAHTSPSDGAHFSVCDSRAGRSESTAGFCFLVCVGMTAETTPV